MSFFVNSSKIMIHREKIVASEGQLEYTLNKSYQPNENRLRLTIGGIPQFSPDNFIEVNSTSFRLLESVPNGTEIIIEILQ